MNIHFIGLSCFLIENKNGFRILVDPFNDAPEWKLGPSFPKTFRGKPFGTNLVLMSEPDADHAYAPGDWMRYAPATKPKSVPFPKLDLRGTIIHEHNGDLNIAWHYTIDGMRLAHFADLAHALNKDQLKELGTPDIIFLSPPKVSNKESLEIVRKNIAALKPKHIIWAHHLAPAGLPKTNTVDTLRKYFVDYFKKNASTNAGYKNPQSFMELCSVLENAILLNAEYNGIETLKTMIEISKSTLSKKKPQSILFRSMIAN